MGDEMGVEAGTGAGNTQPTNNPNKDADNGDSVIQLLKTREWLQNQVVEYRAMLQAAGVETQPDTSDIEKMQERIGELLKALLEKTADVDLRQLLMYRLQMSNAMATTVFSGGLDSAPGGTGDGSGGGLQRQDQDRLVMEILEQQTKLVSDILKLQEDSQSLQPSVDRLRKETLELKQATRELMYTIQQGKEEQQAARALRQRNDKIQTANADLNRELEKLTMLRHIFQGLILGSGISWADDPDVTQLVLTLGRPINSFLSSSAT